MMDSDFKISEIRPKLILEILHSHKQLNDLCLSELEEDGSVIGCTFGPMKSTYENKKGTEYGKLYDTNNYHQHDFMIRINGRNLFICKEHLKLLSTLSKELSSFD